MLIYFRNLCTLYVALRIALWESFNGFYRAILQSNPMILKMKRFITFWLPISVALFFLSILVYKGLDIIFEPVVPIAISDSDLYDALREPLIGTISDNGTTLRPDGDQGRVFVYSFNGYMTSLPYRITLSQNVQFHDCAGCIGNWQAGMFSPPEYNGEFISLKEFIIQMIHSNNENPVPSNTMAWHADNFIWELTPGDKEDEYLIEVWSSSDKKWKIRM